MKLKQCALALVALLCMSLCTISGAYAAEGPVFSMDLSAYSNMAPVIKNAAAGGATDGITFKGANNTSGNPQLAVYDSTNGSTPYLTFTDPENVTTAGRYGSFQIEQSKLTELGITDSDALTVEWWGKTYSGADGKYDMTVIDRLTGATVATKADIGSTCEYILCQQYDTPGNGKYLNVAKFKVYRYTLPEIASHNGGSLTLDDEVLKLGFNEALSVDSVKDEAFTLTNSDTGRTVLTALDGYDAESKTVSLKLREYLDAENHYSLAVVGVQNEEGFAVADGTAVTFTAPADEARVTDVTFKNAAGEPITALGTEKNVSVTAAVYGSLMQTRTYTMYVLLRDADGTVVDVAAGTAQGVGNVNVSVALKGNVTVGEGYSVQCLVWENTDMGYRALQQAADTLR